MPVSALFLPRLTLSLPALSAAAIVDLMDALLSAIVPTPPFSPS